MFLAFVFILATIGALLTLGLYSSFVPFFEQLGSIKEYDMAYYAAMGGLERAMLVQSKRERGFGGSGGYDGVTTFGPVSDSTAIYTNPRYKSASRSIRGSDTMIPSAGDGTIPLALNAGSNDRLMLGYGQPQKIYMSLDTTPSTIAYGTTKSITPRSNISSRSITIQMRLNPLVKAQFASQLDDANDADGDLVPNDVLIDRSWKGRYIGSDPTKKDYAIIPQYNTALDGTIKTTDEGYRETALEASQNLTFGVPFNPIVSQTSPKHRVIGDTTMESISFSDLLANNDYEHSVTLTLVNPLTTQLKQLYPFGEYTVSCAGCNNSERFTLPTRTLEGQARVGDYTVSVRLRQDISNTNRLAEFAVVF